MRRYPALWTQPSAPCQLPISKPRESRRRNRPVSNGGPHNHNPTIPSPRENFLKNHKLLPFLRYPAEGDPLPPTTTSHDERRRPRGEARVCHQHHQWPRAVQPRGRRDAGGVPDGAVRAEVLRLQREQDAAEAVSCRLLSPMFFPPLGSLVGPSRAAGELRYMMTNVNVSYYSYDGSWPTP